MSVASGTATTAELRTLYNEVARLKTMLEGYNNGDAGGTRVGRFTAAQIDTQITAVSTAITAVNA